MYTECLLGLEDQDYRM